MQRWYILRKKQGNTKGSTSSQPPETQLAAAHRAMNLALDRPMSDNLKSVSHKAAGNLLYMCILQLLRAVHCQVIIHLEITLWIVGTLQERYLDNLY